MRKLLSIFLGVVIVFCIGFILYSRTYTIANNKKQLKSSIIQFINRPIVVFNNIDIKEELNLDNKKYVLFIINNCLGDAELTKGFNNKYKIESTGYGSGFFRDEIKQTNKGKYLILKGKNYNKKIAYAKVLLDNKEYKIIIPQQEYFMVYCAVPIKTQRVFPDANDIKFFNSSDVDITNDVFKVLL